MSFSLKNTRVFGAIPGLGDVFRKRCMRPILERQVLTDEAQPFSMELRYEFVMIGLVFFCWAILSQFLIAFFFPDIMSGHRPSSSKAPRLVERVPRPSSSLQNLICRFSTGFIRGNFKHPQKSEPYLITFNFRVPYIFAAFNFRAFNFRAPYTKIQCL